MTHFADGKKYHAELRTSPPEINNGKPLTFVNIPISREQKPLAFPKADGLRLK
jgi:hypothetical protein